MIICTVLSFRHSEREHCGAVHVGDSGAGGALLLRVPGMALHYKVSFILMKKDFGPIS